MDTITFTDFKKLDIRVGKIISAEKVEDADKLIKLEVDLGTEKRQIIAGIADSYSPDELVDKQIPILMNLEPKKIRGLESQGMILAADVNGKPILLHPDKNVPAGSSIN